MCTQMVSTLSTRNHKHAKVQDENRKGLDFAESQLSQDLIRYRAASMWL